MIPTAFDAVYASIFLRFLRRTYRKLSPGGPGGYTVIAVMDGNAYILGRFHLSSKAVVYARRAKAVLDCPVYTKGPMETGRIIVNLKGKVKSIFDADCTGNECLQKAQVLACNASQTRDTTRP